MVSKIVLALCLMVAVASAVPAAGGPGGWPGAGWAAGWGAGAPGAPAWPAPGGANPWIPPWVSTAPWFPVFSPGCSPIGSTCGDCTTKVVCTKVGQLQRPCTDPLYPYCNLGECSATPSAECAPTTDAPAAV